MPYEDKTLTCVDCGQTFTHSGEDQARYAERGFTNEPKRCRPCREQRRGQSGGRGATGQGGSRPPRETFEVVCAECGKTTTVPFKPTADRPVYCRDCYRARRG